MLDSAHAVVEAWAGARKAGKGICVVNNRLIEKLHVEESERLLELKAAIEAQADGAPGKTASAA